MRLFLAACLVLICLLVNCNQACKAILSKKRMICYFASWAGSRLSPANIQPEDFDPCLCTHVLYSFVDLRNSRLDLKPLDKDLFARMAKWKTKNPILKISISIGGWNEQSTHFTPMVSTQENRRLFCQSVVDTCREWNLDGIDIDWEYPSVSQKTQYSEMMRTCFDLFDQEAKESGKKRLLLTAATAPDSRMDALDLPVLDKLLDFINPMTYDIHGSWDGNSAHHSPLFGWDGADSTLKKYINAGMSPDKLNLGLAAYGRATCPPGPYTQEGGVLAYFEVCQLLDKSWREIYDSSAQVPKAQNSVGHGHVFYDNLKSMVAKAQYVLSQNIGGAFIWDTSLDDFNGLFCCQGKFPLISSVMNTFIGFPVNTSLNCANSPPSTVSVTSSTTFVTSSTSSVTSSTSSVTSSTSSVTSSTSSITYIITSKLSNPTTSTYSTTSVTSTTASSNFSNASATSSIASMTSSTASKLSSALSSANNPLSTVSSILDTTTTQKVTSVTKYYQVIASGNEFYGLCTNSSREYYAHPSDCTKFIECKKNEATLTITESVAKCVSNLKFNAQLSACDWPENVVCSQTTSSEPTLAITSSSSTNQLSNTTSSSTSTIATSIKWQIVAANPSEFYSLCTPDATFKPHPYDCSKFIKCTKNETSQIIYESILSCPANLFYDAYINGCNWAANVECKREPTTTRVAVYSGPCKPGDLLLPHPTACNKFIKCSKDTNTGEIKDTVITCPPPLLFDASINNCNWASNVICF